MIHESRRSRPHFDFLLAGLAFGLAAFGVLFVTVATFSADSPTEDTILNYIVSSYSGQRQALFFLISPIVVGAVTYFPHDFLRRRTMVFYIAANILMLVALGSRAAGSNVSRWIEVLWGYTVQPCEFVKLPLILVTAKYLESNRDPLRSWSSALRLAIPNVIPWILTLAQNETGSMLVMVFVLGVMLFFGGTRLRVLGGIIATGVIGLLILYGITVSSGADSYRLDRILAFINPDLVEEAAKYQVNNSRIAIGSGGMYGVGLFVPGSFSQLDFVPENWNDFIFSTIGEAIGFVGSAILFLAYLLMIVRLLYLAYFTLDRFGQMVIIGVMGMFLFHIMENLGMNIGLMPVTGIPLPFVTYGGSSLVTNMACIGLVLNVVKNRSIAGHAHLTPQTYAHTKYTR
ncbi:MAG: rod shape-determining protein RodA [Clostridia bacterium]|nr:rod shape-determining protein RodA [Clostridia bacterium]